MFRKIIIGFFGLIVLGAVISSIQDANKTPLELAEQEARKIARQRVGLAEVTCTMEAERQAHDPKSIEWLRDERQFQYGNKEQTKAISRQPMRAKNAMGALVRTAVTCRLKRDGDNWEVTKLTVLR